MPAYPPPVGVILVQEAGSALPQAAAEAAADDAQAPFAELNEALAAARARLEELSRAASAAAAAGQARQELEALKQENQRLQSELAAARASRDELRTASQTNVARVAELTGAAEEAAAEAKRIEQELVRLRWQNDQLNTSLTRARAASEQAEKEARAAQAGLAIKVETLSASAQHSAAEIARLRQELEDARQQIELATAAGSASEERLADLQAQVQSAEARSRGFDEQLATLRGQVEARAKERDRALQRVAEVETDGQRLRIELAAASAEIERAVASRSEVEREVELLRTAASSAADVARQNLLAVEAGIKELNAALAGGEPAAGEAVAPGAVVATAVIEAPVREDRRESVTTAATGAAATVAPSAEPQPRPSATPPSQPTSPDPSPTIEVATAEPQAVVDDDLELIKSAHGAGGPADEALQRLGPDLPPEMRLQVQGLLVDLGAKLERRGLAMTVPGEELFTVNSETIEPTAFDTLSKVAELIDAYPGQKVMIVGHTDAIGDEAYNQMLSQRRAELVKQFFVDNFDMDSERLSTDGRGEAQPIANNATSSGRKANRRVEVLILD